MGAWRSCAGSTRPAAIRRAGPKIPAAGSPRPAWWPPGSPRTTAGWPAAAGHARTRGLQPVLDVVAGSEPAIALYERSGWELAGTETATWVTPAGSSPTLRCYIGP